MESAMNSCKLFWTTIMIFSTFGVIGPQRANCASDGCSLHMSEDDSLGKPVIFGEDYLVPTLRLRFVDEKTGMPVAPKVVNIHYYWLWLAYPYPEHEWGAWEDGEEWVQCTGGQSEIIIPERTTRTRGWYNGKYTRFPWPKKPKFDRLEIVIEFDHSAPRLIVEKGDLSRYKNSIAIVKLPSAGRATAQFEKLSN